MAKQKKNCIKESGVLISLNEDNEIILTSELDEELLTENLTKKILELSKEFGSLKIVITDYSPKHVERKAIYKYKCEKCGEEIKSKVIELHATHVECDGAKFIAKE